MSKSTTIKVYHNKKRLSQSDKVSYYRTRSLNIDTLRKNWFKKYQPLYHISSRFKKIHTDHKLLGLTNGNLSPHIFKKGVQTMFC